MSTSPQPTTHGRAEAEQENQGRAQQGERAKLSGLVESWVFHGLAWGAAGAFVVATFFLVVDLLAGRPLWTPTALGSALFLGEPHPRDAGPVLPLVVGYTLVHGVAFVAVATTAASELATRARPRLVPGILALAVAFFVVLEGLFLIFATLIDTTVPAALGIGLVAVANLLAALVMAAGLVRTAPGASSG
jgi:hypothetical protein